MNNFNQQSKIKFLTHSKSKNYIITIAIGKKSLNEWHNYCKPNILKYCKKNSLGLGVVHSDLISKDNKFWKKPTWQKYIIGKYITDNKINIKNVCFLDQDILVNPNAENIFKHHQENKISLISQIKNLPYSNLHLIQRKIAFNRHHHLSKRYPLDSALFMSLKQIYKFNNCKPQNDYACAGVFVFNVKKFSQIMNRWFEKYDKNLVSLSGGGDEGIMNYEMLNHGKINWIDYKFQALWGYEIAFKYSFLYKHLNNKKLVRLCVEDSLSDNYFVHYAGGWDEFQVWKMKNIFSNKKLLNENKKFFNYLKTKVTGKPRGRILPKTK